MLYDFHIVDVFTSSPFAGNQLAVLPNAEGISVEGMRLIAREFNFTESTFVLPPTDPAHNARVRIFTPRAELDFAGHPTIGTACALVSNGHLTDRELVLEEGVGPIEVSVRDHNDCLAATLTTTTPLASTEVRPTISELASVLSLDPSQVTEGYFASLGVDFCFARLASPDIVDAATIDPPSWQQFARNAWSSNMFFYSGNPIDDETLYARMSAPAHDVSEDPATGSAVAALVGWVATQTKHDVHVEVIQGAAMGRRSEITATARVGGDGGLQSVEVGGPTRMCATGQIEVDESFLDRP